MIFAIYGVNFKPKIFYFFKCYDISTSKFVNNFQILSDKHFWKF